MVKLPDNINIDNISTNINDLTELGDFDRKSISPHWYGTTPLDKYKVADYHFSDPIPDLSTLSKEHIDDLKADGWIDEKGDLIPLQYVTYEYGYRSKLTKDPSAVFLGCSHTFGTGLNLEQTFSYKVSKELGLRNINLAYPGGSLDSCYRTLKNHIKDLRPKYVFCLAPNDFRTEIFIKHSYLTLDENDPMPNESKNIVYSTTMAKNSKIGYMRGGKDWLNYLKYNLLYIIDTPEQRIINYNKNLDAIKLLCLEANCKFINIPVKKYWQLAKNTDMYREFGHARDWKHFGEKFHDLVTKDFLSLI